MSALLEEADGYKGPLLVPGSSWSPVEVRKSTLGPFVVAITVALKKKKNDVQLESCKLSFIWSKMRTAAWVRGQPPRSLSREQ